MLLTNSANMMKYPYCFSFSENIEHSRNSDKHKTSDTQFNQHWAWKCQHLLKNMNVTDGTTSFERRRRTTRRISTRRLRSRWASGPTMPIGTAILDRVHPRPCRPFDIFWPPLCLYPSKIDHNYFWTFSGICQQYQTLMASQYMLHQNRWKHDNYYEHS